MKPIIYFLLHTHYAHREVSDQCGTPLLAATTIPIFFLSFFSEFFLNWINFSFLSFFPFFFFLFRENQQYSEVGENWSTGSFNIRLLFGIKSKVARKRGSLEGFPGVVYAKDVYPRRINVGRLTNRERIASRVCGLLAQSSIAGCQLKHPLSWHVTGACLLAFQGRAPGPETLAILLVMELIYPMPRSLILERCNHAISCDTRSLDFYRARKHIHRYKSRVYVATVLFVPLLLRWNINI